MNSSTQILIEKIKALPGDRLGEVEDFIDFIATRAQDTALARAATSASAPAFARVWDNSEDDIYDVLPA